jgi:hypothetical protein
MSGKPASDTFGAAPFALLLWEVTGRCGCALDRGDPLPLYLAAAAHPRHGQGLQDSERDH